MQKFRDYDFPPEFGAKSEAMKQVHQERKKQSLMDDLDKMREAVEKKPIVEVDERGTVD